MLIKLIQPRMTMRPMDSIIKPRMAPSLGLLTLAALMISVFVLPTLYVWWASPSDKLPPIEMENIEPEE